MHNEETKIELAWLAAKINYIKTLKTPNAQQQLLLLLAEKPNLENSDKKKLTILVKAEKAIDRANKARTSAAAMIQSEKKAEVKALRAKRTHELCESAGLMSMAGLIDKITGKPTIDIAELLGALLGLAAVPANDSRRNQWRQAGHALLEKQKTIAGAQLS